jgi:hypothetical protein
MSFYDDEINTNNYQNEDSLISNINSIDEAMNLITQLEDKVNLSDLDIEEMHEINMQIEELEAYLAEELPKEATRMIEDAKGLVSANMSLRNSFKKILRWMAKYCEWEIPNLPEYK